MTIFVLLVATADLLFAGIVPAAILVSEAIVEGGPSVWLTAVLFAAVEVILAVSALHKAVDVA